MGSLLCEERNETNEFQAETCFFQVAIDTDWASWFSACVRLGESRGQASCWARAKRIAERNRRGRLLEYFLNGDTLVSDPLFFPEAGSDGVDVEKKG